MKLHVPTAMITAAFAILLFAIIGIGAREVNLVSASHDGAVAPARHIGLGAWTEGLFDPSTQTLNPQALLSYEQLTSKKVEYAHYYLGWESLADPSLLTQFNQLRSYGWKPVLSVDPYYFSGCPASQLPLYRAIAEGKCDDFLHKAGKNLSQLKQPFYLVFAYEMNNSQNDWSITSTGSTNSDFILAWRHIYTVFRQENANNVVWVFDPNVPETSATPYNKIYPGDDYVDWLGLDGYNWGTTQPWSQWASFSGVFTGSYNKLLAISPHKPMMIVEVNTTDQGGDKSQWYTDMLTQQVPYHFPDIQAVLFYNENRTTQEHVNWKVDVTPETLRAFTSGIHSRFY
jgi:hypothetical protein